MLHVLGGETILKHTYIHIKMLVKCSLSLLCDDNSMPVTTTTTKVTTTTATTTMLIPTTAMAAQVQAS